MNNTPRTALRVSTDQPSRAGAGLKAPWRREGGLPRHLHLAACLLALGLLALLGATAASAQDPVLKDNGKIAFVSARSGDPEIYTMNPDGTQQTQLTSNAPPPDSPIPFLLDFWPDWSPDGTKIVFASVRDDGNAEIYVMNADGSGQT